MPKKDGKAAIKAKEDAVQRSIIGWAELAIPRVLVIHVPNGGLRSKIEAGILKSLGVKAGFPDLVLWCPGGIAVPIEVKVPGNLPEPHQWDRIHHLRALGFKAGWADSIEMARELVRSAGVTMRDVTP